MSTEIRIYVADLSAYNEGKLHGVWINATDYIEDIQAQINNMLAKSPEQDAEEYAIHDFEGFNGYSLEEYNCIETVHDIAFFIMDNPEIGGELLNYCNGDLDRAKTEIVENYCGCYKSIAEYAEELTNETSQIPNPLTFYINYDKMARDMELNGDVYTIETSFYEIHIFLNH